MKPQGKLKMQGEKMNFLRSKQNIGNQNSTYLVYGVKYQRKIDQRKKKHMDIRKFLCFTKISELHLKLNSDRLQTERERGKILMPEVGLLFHKFWL